MKVYNDVFKRAGGWWNSVKLVIVQQGVAIREKDGLGQFPQVRPYPYVTRMVVQLHKEILLYQLGWYPRIQLSLTGVEVFI